MVVTALAGVSSTTQGRERDERDTRDNCVEYGQSRNDITGLVFYKMYFTLLE